MKHCVKLMLYSNNHTREFFFGWCILAVLLMGCSGTKSEEHPIFETVYGYLERGNRDSADIALSSLRPRLNLTDAEGAEYYLLKAEATKPNIQFLKLYSDSAMLFFKAEKNKKHYPKLYSRALFVKGDYYYQLPLYNNALKYYSETLLQPEWATNRAAVYHKIGLIYFNQTDYKKAAPYLSYSALAAANDTIGKTANKFFYKIQNSLNNAGLAYERAGNLDSAYFFYTKNKTFIHGHKHLIADTALAAAAEIIMWDNLGQLYLKRGMKDSAYAALKKAVSIPHAFNDGILLHPHVKLAKLSAADNNREAEKYHLYLAGKAIDELEKRYLRSSMNSVLDYNNQMAAYYLLANKLDSSRHYQSIYADLRDSIESVNQSLYKLDIESELKNIQQNQAINQLNQENEMRLYYFLIAVLCSVLLAVILFLIKRNLHKTLVLQQTTERHNEELKCTLEELEKANQNYLRVMRVMAHDLKNPISGITGLSEVMIYEDGVSDAQKEMLELIMKTSINATSMINELLSAALNEDTEVKKERGDLIALAADSIDLLKFKAKEKRQSIYFKHNVDRIEYDFNFQELSRAVNNLIVNAIKFSHTGSDIEVGVFKGESDVVLYVKDQGIGIKAADREQVFEMFTNAKRKGTNGETPFGLGLSITKRIVERHNGQITLESEEGKGTTFYIKLPLEELADLHRNLKSVSVLN